MSRHSLQLSEMLLRGSLSFVDLHGGALKGNEHSISKSHKDLLPLRFRRVQLRPQALATLSRRRSNRCNSVGMECNFITWLIGLIGLDCVVV